MSEPDTSPGHCENCGEKLQGEFCHTCGQSIQSTGRFFGSILMDLLDNLFSYDSRVVKTFVPLMLKPGHVCSEYLAGKRASFLPPFRLYLFASIVFFLFVPFLNDISVTLDLGDPLTTAGENPEEEGAGYIALNRNDSQVNVVGIRPGAPDEIDMDFPFFVEPRRAMREKIYSMGEQDSDALLDTSLNTLPTLMFFLLPLLALTLKIAYLSGRRYYMEHLIVVLYSQSYLFFMLLLVLVLDQVHVSLRDSFPSLAQIHMLMALIVTLVYLWIPLHLFLFFKKVYAQSWAMTLVKFSAVSAVYMGLLVIAATVTVVWGIFSI